MAKKKCDLLQKVDGLCFDAGWRKFDIVVKADLYEGGSECWGFTDFDQCTIYIRETNNFDIARETLIHEITHVILTTVGFGGYDHDEMGGEFTDGYIAPTNNEHLTLCISRGFMSAFNYNKELFEILIKEEQ